MSNRVLWGSLCILTLCISWRFGLSEERPVSSGYPALGREVVEIIRGNFVDVVAARAWAEENASYAKDIRDEASFTKRTNELLAQLKASHTHYYRKRDTGYWALAAIFADTLELDDVAYESIGLDVTDQHFVRSVLAGSPAQQAGLLRGDRILAADGGPFEPIRSFEEKAGKPVKLLVERKAGGTPIELTVVPRKINPKQEWLEAQRRGARIISRQGIEVAYMPMYWTAGEGFQELIRELIAKRFADADALIIDFRDGWGGCNPDFVNYFNTAPPVLTLIDRDGEKRVFDPQWRKQLFVLVNGGSRSGKEVVAHALQREKRATLVGARSAGFVAGGRPYLLSDRSLLYVAVMKALVDGKPLEGIGVTPDIIVEDQLEYAAGADQQLDRALELAARTKPPDR